METTYWTMISHIFTWGSLGFYFCILFFLYSDGLCLMFPNVFQFLGKAMPTQYVARRLGVGLRSVTQIHLFNKCSLSTYYYVLGSVDIDMNKTWSLP